MTAISTRQLYTKLAAELREISCLGGIHGLLEWDQSVMMPPGAADARERQITALAGIVHEKRTSTTLGGMLADLRGRNDLATELDAFEAKAVKIPKELEQRMASLTSSGYNAWVEAREKSDFSILAPVLREWVDVLKQKATCIDATRPVYEVLLDDFERGMQASRLDDLFRDLKSGLLPLIKRIQASPNKPDRSFLAGRRFDVGKQTALNHRIARELGFDETHGRLDSSAHPFTGGSGAYDVRMTTRYRDDDLVEGITGTVHETGHALYEQGRNAEHADLPVSEAMSMGIHESQSLLWERMVCLSEEFWECYWPAVLEQFGEELAGVTAQEFHRVINESKPGFVRVESDEVTYPMHIILRYEIERGLFDGTVSVDDLPRVWNAKMKEYLGVVPPNDKLGVLQDPHWAQGAFGYFPTYTLGAIYANQFFQQAMKDLPMLREQIARGEFAPLKSWLNNHIHKQGSLLGSGDALAKQVTGSTLDAALFVEYLTQKYVALYKL